MAPSPAERERRVGIPRGGLALLGVCCACAWESARGASAASARCTALLAAYVEPAVAGAPDAEKMEARAEVRTAVGSMGLQEALDCGEEALRLSQAQPVAVAQLLEQVARHTDCARELATKAEAQTRCAQKWYKIAIHALTVVGKMDAAEAMWQRATSLRTESASPSASIGWPSISQTPTVWISSLESKNVWNCSQWPFLRQLEEAAPRILEELEAVSEKFTTAYPYLARGGTWQDLFLYRGHEWDTALCDALPRTCRLLLPELPTKPGVPFATAFHEEVVIFRSEPGASVGAHCGSSNAVINLHLTLKGARGTSLRIGDEEHPLQDGRALCFQDSFFHSVEHRGDGEAERVSLVVRVMHPRLGPAAYGASAATDVVPSLAAFDRAAALEAEVARLRAAYRRLAREGGGEEASC